MYVSLHPFCDPFCALLGPLGLIYYSHGISQCHCVRIIINFYHAYQCHILKYSQLSRNEHLYKTDISLRETHSAGPKGVRI